MVQVADLELEGLSVCGEDGENQSSLLQLV